MNCLQSKKQKLNQPGGSDDQPNQANPHRYTNGHSSNAVTNHNGHNGVNNTNGYSNGLSYMQPKIACPDMCIFCFDVLHCELNNMGEPSHPNFTNDA